MSDSTPQASSPLLPLPAPLASQPSPLEDRRAAAPSPQETPPSTSLEDLWRIHEYVHEYIRFADTKAAAVIAFASALLGALFAARPSVVRPDLAKLSDAVAMLCLAAAIGVATWAIKPRLTREHPTGMIFWGSISRFRSGADYARALNDEKHSFPDHLAAQVYTVSRVCSAKYYWSSVAILLAVVGGVLGGLSLLASR